MNRIDTLVNLWYLGEIIETLSGTGERVACIKEIGNYYTKMSKKVYYLFEIIGIEQIARSRNITLTMIHKLSKAKHLELVSEAMSIAGARMERGGSC